MRDDILMVPLGSLAPRTRSSVSDDAALRLREFHEYSGSPEILGRSCDEYETQIEFEGSGVLAGMMNKMGGVSTALTVSAVSTDPIPDDRFAVPAGYKTTNK